MKEPDAVLRIGSVCIPTRNRPRLLRLALASYLTLARRHDRTPEFVVVDDSDDPAASLRVRAVVGSLGRRFGLRIRHADRAARLAFADLVARHAGLPAALVRLGLVGQAGATRNCILLDTLGTAYLQVDDDTVGRVFAPPSTAVELRLTSEGDANDHWYYPSLATAKAAATPFHGDLWSMHEEVLGQRLPAVLAGATGPIRIGQRLSSLWLEDGFARNARVAVSYGGTVGHCGGLGLPQYRLKVGGASFDRLVSDEAAFHDSYFSTQMIRCAPCLTLADVDYCVTAHMAVDHRESLPPYPPTGACEDTLFGIVRSAVRLPDLVAFLPVAVLHDAGSVRSPNAPPPLTTRTNDILIELVGRFLSESPARGQARMEDLGRYLVRVAALERGEFHEYVALLQVARISAHLRHLDQLLTSRPKAPEFWRARVREYRDQWKTLLVAGDLASPSDLPGSPDQRSDRLRGSIGNYGELLLAWPAIVATASELRDAGRRLSRPL